MSLGIDGLADLTQALAAMGAVIGGAIWGYYNYVKSRVFKARLSVAIDTRSSTSNGVILVVVKARINNVGSGRTRLSSRGTAIRIWAHVPYEESEGAAELDSRLIGTFAIFEGHDVVEPLEEFSDCKVLQIDDDDAEAVTVDLRVLAESTVFRAKDVVFLREVEHEHSK